MAHTTKPAALGFRRRPASAPTTYFEKISLSRRSEPLRAPQGTLAIPDSAGAPRNRGVMYASRDDEIAAFFDSLSMKPLSRGTLREVQRRLDDLIYPTRPSAADQLSVALEPSDGLMQFAKLGGPDLRDLRGYPAFITPSMDCYSSYGMTFRADSSKSMEIDQAGMPIVSQPPGRTKSSSAYSPEFEQNLIDKGIYHYLYDSKAQPAKNEDEISARLNAPHPFFPSSAIPRRDFMALRDRLDQPRGRSNSMAALISVLRLDPQIPSRAHQVFNNLSSLTGFNLFHAKPDIYDGALQSELHPDVRKQLYQYIQPSNEPAGLIVPNFFLECKAAGAGDDILIRRALHNGALGARAMHHLRCFGLQDAADNDTYSGEAETITVTYKQPGELKFYSVHYVRPQNGSDRPDCYMNHLTSHNLSGGSYKYHLAGLVAFRNAREWAKERRDAGIARANRVMAGRTSTLAAIQ